eukprot:22355-Hanusia_phi.AAC.1
MTAASQWMSAQGISVPEQAVKALLQDWPAVCYCRTEKVKSPTMCNPSWKCTGPCEDSAFGHLVQFNENYRDWFNGVVKKLNAWGPLLLLLCCFAYLHELCSTDPRDGKIEKLEKT